MNRRVIILSILSFTLVSLLHAQDAAKPATALQIKDAIDWTKVPTPEGSTKVRTYFSSLSCLSPGTYAKAAEFYRQRMPELGWNEDTSIDNGNQKDYLSLTFEKNGMGLGIHGYRSKPDDPMNVHLSISGNVDISLFPKMADAEVKNSSKSVAYYFSKQPVEEVVAFCRKFMKERGWAEKVHDMAETWAKEGRHVLQFQQNAMECTLVAAKKDGQVEVTYSSHVRHHLSPEDIAAVFGKDQPRPATAKEATEVINMINLPLMRKDAKGQRHSELFSSYEVPESIDEAAAFYRQLLKEQGWTELSPLGENEYLSRLYFEKKGFLLCVNAQKGSKEDKTRVTLRNHGNVDLRKLPVPEGTEIETLRFEHMNLETKLTIDQAHDFYRQELAKLGWKNTNPTGKTTLKFVQNDVTLSVEIQSNVYKKTSVKLSVSMR